MASAESLAAPLSTKTSSPGLRLEIINDLLELQLTREQYEVRSNGINAYFDEWYDQQCGLCAHGVSIRTHGELQRVVSYLRSPSADRQSILDLLCQSQPNGNISIAEHEATIDLAARVLLGISVGSTPSFVLLLGDSLSWVNGTLQSLVSQSFQHSSGTFEDIKLPRNFTAANIERIAGIKVNWTSNLTDHLLLKDAETTDAMVMIYHPISFLELHKLAGCEIISNALVEETTSSLKLLLPSNNEVSKSWFKQQQRKNNDRLDESAGSCGHFQTRDRKIENFPIWKERLVVLKQAFDDSEPKTLKQRWYDDRKKGEWYTFWLAMLIAFLTVLTVVFGIIQCWASIKALH